MVFPPRPTLLLEIMSNRKKEIEELLAYSKKEMRAHKVDWSKKDGGASIVEYQTMLDFATKLRIELDELLVKELANRE